MSEGIWGHSSQVGGEEYIIATMDNPKDLPELQDWFRDNVPVIDGATGYKLLYGVWKGEREQPIMFNAKLWGKLWGWFDNQEAIIVVGKTDARDRRPATFMAPCFNCGHLEPIAALNGDKQQFFVEVEAAEAWAQDGYTFDPKYGRYYMLKCA